MDPTHRIIIHPRIETETKTKSESSEDQTPQTTSRENVELTSPLFQKKKVKKYKESERLTLQGMNPRDGRFLVKKMEIPKGEWRLTRWLRSFRWVRFKTGEGEKEIYVNIRSLSKRLLLEPNAITAAAAKKGGLEALVDTRTKALQGALEVYQKQFSAYKEKYPETTIEGEFLLKITLASSGLWQKMKVSNEEDQKKVFDKLSAGILVNEKNNEYIVRADSHKVHVIDMTKPKLIGGGGEGIVYRVRDAATNAFMSMKVTRNPLHGEREAKQLLALQAKAPKHPFQKPPTIVTKITVITGKDSSQEVGVLIGDLYKAPSLSRPDMIGYIKMMQDPENSMRYQGMCIDCLKKVWEQFNALGEIYHGDIKPENIFISEDPETFHFVLADWSGSEIGYDKEMRQHIYSEEATPTRYIKSPSGIYSKDVNQRKRAQKSHDLFATLRTMFIAITGKEPYVLQDRKGHYIKGDGERLGNAPVVWGDFKKELLEAQGCSQALIDFFGTVFKRKPEDLNFPRNVKEADELNRILESRWKEVLVRGFFK